MPAAFWMARTSLLDPVANAAGSGSRSSDVEQEHEELGSACGGRCGSERAAGPCPPRDESSGFSGGGQERLLFNDVVVAALRPIIIGLIMTIGLTGVVVEGDPLRDDHDRSRSPASELLAGFERARLGVPGSRCRRAASPAPDDQRSRYHALGDHG